ncbi:GlnP5 [Desulforapulum autotrophicum HRM2]|uniref:GlnP5 n=1 Tax=Desulforapulum autotrophicum (strain ATCC 43914 / DSM 3382 / VKM B-1955 / HRM2) TaxID=177437 RepID=C0QCR2_DESAH|nr:amino acid ABC transporter permease [Desulforapulum autotrophicum]ACN15139.1 GlnP5 [Desulforapulum autotrophicum HRM2]
MNEFLAYAAMALPEMLQGTVITLKLTAGALLIGILIGLPLSLVRVYGGKLLQPFCSAYLTLFRGTPLLVQLFVVYYGLPELGISFSRMTAAFLTLGCNSAAYQCEYFRGAIQAVSKGQMRAARGIGMSKLQGIRHIILPQALRLVIPAWSNEFIAMVKYTAIVFLIAVPDLMSRAKILSSQNFAPIQTYILVALIYLVLVGTLSLGLHFVQQRLAVPGFDFGQDAR